MKFDVRTTLQRILFKLKMYREIKLVSQSEAAEALGVGLRSYQRIEAGETICDIEFLLRFCEFFEVNFDHLVSPSAPLPNKYQKLYKNNDEIKEFESLEALTGSKFFKFANKFCSQKMSIDEIAATSEFVDFPEKLIVCNTQKKFFNKMTIDQLRLNRSYGKTFVDCRDISGIISILDNLHYHRPKYSIVEPTMIIKPRVKNTFFTGYNAHYFGEDNNTISISMLVTQS